MLNKNEVRGIMFKHGNGFGDERHIVYHKKQTD